MALIAATILFNQDALTFYDLVQYDKDDDVNETSEFTVGGHTFEVFMKDSVANFFEIEGSIEREVFTATE